jgi:hypothetical protein
MDLTSKACSSVRGEGQGAKEKSTNLKGKCIRKNTPMAHGSNRLAKEVAAYRMDGPVQGKLGWSGWIPGDDTNRNWFLNSNGFLNLAILWEFLQGDLGGILMWGFFLNSSRILKDFRKKYNMKCHSMHPRQDYF